MSVDSGLLAPRRSFYDAATAIYELSRAGLVIAVWVSAGLFGLYILAFYAAAVLDGHMQDWNGNLPGLYSLGTPVATGGLALHFLAGGIILSLGCIQLSAAIRRRLPWLHRWIGRIYVTASLLAGAGGLSFILTKGTIGGPFDQVMDFFFYVPNLLVVEVLLRSSRRDAGPARRLGAAAVFVVAIGFLALGTYYFTKLYWGPAILARLS